ncbi:hypothetical protein [Pontibacter sp. G13]|uniref:tetratricopeptide repeat protein n=1 Tax=Pontibacter sp. G13 TaxID=3074898 RepID=UPI0028899FE7|nr:hypothetical protein [Pontibacter sp. G13]WNJ18855.1 hypothetical protein RJD25_00030 [Pontibacter sp. G13]
MKHLLILIALLSGIVPMIKGQAFDDEVFRKTSQDGLSLTYQMDYAAAHAKFMELKRAYPEHPGPYFLLAFNRWWQTYLDIPMETYYGYIEDQLEMCLEKNKELEDTKPREYVFFQFMGYALKARVASYRREWMAAVNSARKVVGPLKESLEFVGDENEFYLPAGLYHYYVATYHEFYPVVRPFLYFFPDGDKELGLEELISAGELPGMTQYEALFYLTYIYLDEIKDLPKGLAITQKLVNDFPSNTWYACDYGRALMLNGKFNQADEVLGELIARFEQQSQFDTRRIDSKESTLTSFLMIKIYQCRGQLEVLRGGSLDEAVKLFNKSRTSAHLAGVENHAYLVADTFWEGAVMDLQGNRSGAIEKYKQVQKMDDNALYKELAKQYTKAPYELAR